MSSPVACSTARTRAGPGLEGAVAREPRDHGVAPRPRSSPASGSAGRGQARHGEHGEVALAGRRARPARAAWRRRRPPARSARSTPGDHVRVGDDPLRRDDDAAALLAPPARLGVADDLDDAALGPLSTAVAHRAGSGLGTGRICSGATPGEHPREVAAGDGAAEVLGQDVEVLGHEPVDRRQHLGRRHRAVDVRRRARRAGRPRRTTARGARRATPATMPSSWSATWTGAHGEVLAQPAAEHGAAELPEPREQQHGTRAPRTSAGCPPAGPRPSAARSSSRAAPRRGSPPSDSAPTASPCRYPETA